MSLFRLFIPEHNRTFPGKRQLKITLRSFHLLFCCGYAGGVFLDVRVDELRLFYQLTTSTGLCLMLIDIWSNGIWIIQNRGWLMLIKLLLIGSMHWVPHWQTVVLGVVILLSGYVSHATGDFRYYSIFHRRRVDQL
jgi:hypothetical protein